MWPTRSYLVETFSSDDRTVGVDVFDLPEGDYPAVILLHGADGLTLRRAAYDRFATILAESGYIVFLPHYFDGTGVTIADKVIMREKFPIWIKTLHHAIEVAATRPNVAPGKIGLLGFSLGASLVLTLAAQRSDISAVVEYFGVMPRVTEAVMTAMPPTLIIHGVEDKIVSVEEAYRLERLLQQHNAHYEMKIFPDEGHFFSGKTAADAARLTVGFFNKYLRPIPPEGQTEGVETPSTEHSDPNEPELPEP